MRTIELAKPVDAECATCNERVNWATHTSVECRNTLWRQREEARADLRRLEATDPHRIARVLMEAREKDTLEWQEQRRDNARVLEIVCQERDEAREAARELLALLQSSAADHDHDEELFARWEWLKEQATVDE